LIHFYKRKCGGNFYYRKCDFVDSFGEDDLRAG